MALLAFDSAATSSTDNRSYPCSCSRRNVTLSSSTSRGVHWETRRPRAALVNPVDTSLAMRVRYRTVPPKSGSRPSRGCGR
ncbi:Uncharacterised protein [Mycobacteroides abscessus subsp. abscessus]|nr:Uncharacterised protein [Mycobacteroides abscessus subsp. abscessus]